MNKVVHYLAKAKPVLSKVKPILTKVKDMPFDKHTSYVFSRVKAAFFVLLFIKFCTVVTTNHYLLKPFSVPPSFDKSGYNGAMLTGQVVNYMEDIRNFKDPSTARGNAYRQIGKTFKESEVSIVENSKAPTPYDPDTWFQAGKKILSSIDGFKEKSITASIVEDTQDSTKVVLTVQVTNRPVHKTPIPNLKQISDSAFFHLVAFEILKETDPIALFDYYIKEDKLLDRAEKLLENLEHNEVFKKDSTNKFRLEVSTINFKLAKAHYLRRELRKKTDATSKEKADNRSEQRKMREDALDLSHELIERNPNDLSAYVQEFSSLAFNCDWLFYLDAIEDAEDIKRGETEREEWKTHFDKLLKDFEEKEESLVTTFYNLEHSRAYIKVTIGYLVKYFYPISDYERESYYKEALTLTQNDVFILNSAAYFYANKKIKDKKEAYTYIGKAVTLKPYDGNLMDSYADIALSFYDTINFYKYFELALKYPKPIDGITIDEYDKDTRFKKMWGRPKFQELMCQYGSKVFVSCRENKEEASIVVPEIPETEPKPTSRKKLKRKNKA